MTLIRFTKDHEWIRFDAEEIGTIITVGITDYAQQNLGDIVFVELPTPGSSFHRGQEVAVIESIKAAVEIYAPLDGQIQDINTLLNDQPSMINTDPMNVGWLFTIRLAIPSQLNELMDEDAYQSYVETLP